MIHTSLSPNTQSDDILLALSLIFRPWRWNKKETVLHLEAVLHSYLDVPHIFTVDSGRTALATILEASGIGVGDEVLIQAYTCVAVPEPILWSGATPVYVDIKDDLTMDPEDLRKKITSKSKVVIIQHTFGKPADVDAIKAIAKEHDLLVIEDCAHALGAKYKGKPVGTLGHVAFFSFGRDKAISSVFGGAIAVSDDTFAKHIGAIVERYGLPSKSWTLRQLLHPLILSFAKATYRFLSLGKVVIEISKRIGLISKAVETVELSGGKPSFVFHRLSPALAQLAVHQLGKIDRFVEHRREIADVYREALVGQFEKQESKDSVSYHSYLRYTLIAQNASSVDAIFARAKKSGIELGNWYRTPLAPQGAVLDKLQYVQGSCPKAESLAPRTFNLPTHIGITLENAAKVVSVVRDQPQS